MIRHLVVPTLAAGLLAGASTMASTPPVDSDTAPAISPNDNRIPAGRLANGVLTLRLEAREGTWRPDAADGGPVINFFDVKQLPPALLNGQRTPAPIDVAAGEPVRFRLINIRTENSMDFQLLDGGQPAQWRVLAKDGMPTPANQSVPRLAKLRSAPGEINVWRSRRAPARRSC